MYRFLLRPAWLALHALTVAAVAACLVLGSWQWASYRDYDRTGTPVDSAPVPLAEVTRPGSALTAAAVGRVVTITGEYDGAHQLVVPDRELAGRAGQWVVTPLRTADGVVPVRRGWSAGAGGPAALSPAGEVTVTGVVQVSESARESRVDPRRALPAGQLPVLATEELLRRLPYPPEQVYDGFVALTAQQPPPVAALEPVPVGPAVRDEGPRRWQNLAYALQWPLFALAAVVFWAVLVRNAGAARRRAAPDTSAPPRSPADSTT